MLPEVIIHNAVSLDGYVTGFDADIGLYYELVSTWKEDATLVGADTILAAPDEIPPEDDSAFQKPNNPTEDTRPLLVIPDSRGRVRSWHYLRTLPYWRGWVALCSRTTPQEYLDYLKKRHIDFIVAGDDHVDYTSALETVASRYSVKTVRADSGGTLNGLLLASGLVSEISLLVHPHLVGDSKARPFFIKPVSMKSAALSGFKLISTEKMKSDIVWMRYRVRAA